MTDFKKIPPDPEGSLKRLNEGRHQAELIIAEMKAKGVTVELFGSMRTGKAFPNSDIDLLVTDCGPLDPEVVLVEIYSLERDISLDVTILAYVPQRSLKRIHESRGD